MADAKLVIYGTILKQNSIFRPRVIIEETGVRSNLVHYHLKSLVEKGLLEKEGPLYRVADRDKLIDTLALREPKGENKMKATALFWNENVDHESINNMIYRTIIAKTLNIEGSTAVKSALIDALDETIKSFQNAKRGLIEGQLDAVSARRKLYKDQDDYVDKYYNFATYLLELDLDRKEIKHDVADHIAEYESEQ